MLSRVGSAKRVAVLSIAAVFAGGCAHADEEVSIAPLVPAAGRVDPGLGPGTRALSSGPGYKGSPSWSPGGDRIAFTVDGYVVDRLTDSGDLRNWTTRDFIAEDIEWISEDTLMILGAASPSGTEETPSSLYRARAAEDSLELETVEKEVSAIGPGRGGLIFALGRGAFGSGLALTRGSGARARDNAARR
jgi:TolB protein